LTWEIFHPWSRPAPVCWRAVRIQLSSIQLQTSRANIAHGNIKSRCLYIAYICTDAILPLFLLGSRSLSGRRTRVLCAVQFREGQTTISVLQDVGQGRCVPTRVLDNSPRLLRAVTGVCVNQGNLPRGLVLECDVPCTDFFHDHWGQRSQITLDREPTSWNDWYLSLGTCKRGYTNRYCSRRGILPTVTSRVRTGRRELELIVKVSPRSHANFGDLSAFHFVFPHCEVAIQYSVKNADKRCRS
jgi:hypothetical protein